MSQIRGHGNKDTEVALMTLFRIHRITGWRRKQTVYGKPDFVFYASRIAVFADGCFWHGCHRCYRQPKSNKIFWKEKFIRNRKRDLQVNRELRNRGWNVVRIWEHDLTKKNESCVRKIQALLKNEQLKK